MICRELGHLHGGAKEATGPRRPKGRSMHLRHLVSTPRTAIETPTARIHLGSMDIGLVVLSAIGVDRKLPRCVKFRSVIVMTFV
jgi:hypothetical protein